MLIGLTGFLYWGFRGIHRVEAPKGKNPKTLATPLELRRFGGFELKLELVRNQGDELRIRGLALGVAHGVASFLHLLGLPFGKILYFHKTI